MPVDPNAPTEANEPVRVPRWLSPAVIMLPVIGGVGLIVACAVTVIAVGLIVVRL